MRKTEPNALAAPRPAYSPALAANVSNIEVTPTDRIAIESSPKVPSLLVWPMIMRPPPSLAEPCLRQHRVSVRRPGYRVLWQALGGYAARPQRAPAGGQDVSLGPSPFSIRRGHARRSLPSRTQRRLRAFGTSPFLLECRCPRPADADTGPHPLPSTHPKSPTGVAASVRVGPHSTRRRCQTLSARYPE